MKDFHKLLFIVLILTFVSSAFAAGDWCGTFSIRGGRTDPSADIESPGKTLFMMGTSFELWYKDLISVGPYVYFSQLHGGPIDESNWDENDITTQNFRTYIAGVDFKARFRPNWSWMNLHLPNQFINRIAPYVDGGFGVITFDPTRRSSYSALIGGDYKRNVSVFPVYGGGITLFSRLGVSGDIGVEFHAPKTDFLDGHEDAEFPNEPSMKKGNDTFLTYYVGLTFINTCKPEAPPVILPPEPEPEPEIEIKFDPELTVTPPVRNVPYQAGMTTFDVISNLNWFVAENCEWITITPLVGSNNGNFTVNYDANPARTNRTCEITVTGGGITRKVQVVQGPGPEPTIVFEKDVSLVLEGVNFKTDEDILTDGAMLILDEVVTTLNAFPEVTLDIQGHTDSDASDAYNIDLSRRRSMSVKNYLVQHGIDANRLTTSWFGERKPLVPNTTPANKAKNRRIEFKRTDK